MKINMIGEDDVRIVCDTKIVLYVADDVVVMFKKIIGKYLDDDTNKSNDEEVRMTQAVRIKPGQISAM